MTKGDIILVKFPFTDLSGTKNRPAVVLISRKSDVVVAFITSKTINIENWDIILEPNIENGLKQTSIIKISKIATLDTTLVLGRIGKIEFRSINKVNESLLELFQLKP